MKRTIFSETGAKNIKCTACIRSMAVSRIFSFSQLMRSRRIPERKKSAMAESKTLEIEIDQKNNYGDAIYRIPLFSLPALIRIRATDKEGNTIEVTY